MPIDEDAALVWFRRDLRVEDHGPLAAALARARRVHCAFVFDRDLLDPLLAEGRARDRRVDFIHRSVLALDAALRQAGGGLIVRHGRGCDEIVRLAAELGVGAVHAGTDYEPAAIARDDAVARALAAAGRRLVLVKDHVVLEKDEVLTAAGRPFGVFTPYRAAWERTVDTAALQERPSATLLARGALAPLPAGARIPALAELGFAPTDLDALGIAAGASGAQERLREFLGRIDAYDRARDFPGLRGPSYLSVHLRFGTLSTRAAVRAARARAGEGARTWLGELIWREFYQMILYHHPAVVDRAWRPGHDRIAWDDDPAAFAAWCEGRTGYPLVDAAMAQINRTGYMHNRLRMVVASFLTKDLGIDWRLGERYFARALIDYDLAANNGGWQWAASTGCDAQPYFRIFNPVTQSERFDPQGAFIRRYLPQLAALAPAEIHAPWRLPAARQAEAGCRIGTDYPAPIVDHAQARARTLARFAAIKG